MTNVSLKPPTANVHEMFVSRQGEGLLVGQQHLFVRFGGCNLRCTYCDTPDALVRVSECRIAYPGGREERRANALSVAGLAEIVEEILGLDPSVAAVAITGGEPLIQHRFLAEWLGTRKPPLPCLLETHAQLPDALASVLAHIDVVSADLKLPSNSGEPERWEEHERFLRASTAAQLYVKMPVDRGTDAAEVVRGARLVASAAPEAVLFIQPISDPVSAEWLIDLAELERFAALAAAEVRDTRILPQLHKMLGIP